METPYIAGGEIWWSPVTEVNISCNNFGNPSPLRAVCQVCQRVAALSTVLVSLITALELSLTQQNRPIAAAAETAAYIAVKRSARQFSTLTLRLSHHYIMVYSMLLLWAARFDRCILLEDMMMCLSQQRYDVRSVNAQMGSNTVKQFKYTLSHTHSFKETRLYSLWCSTAYSFYSLDCTGRKIIYHYWCLHAFEVELV